MPEPKNLHTDSRLSHLSIQYRNEEYIWPMLMPIVRVNKRSDLYTVYNKKDAYKLVDDHVVPHTMSNKTKWDVGEDNYSVKGHALHDFVAQEDLENTDAPIQPFIDTNANINNDLDLAQENRVAGVVFNDATYPTGNKVTLAGTAQWGESADDPVSDVQTAVEGCFVRANTLVFGLEAWLLYRQLPEVLDAVKSSTRQQAQSGGMATAAEVAALFDVPRIIIGRARINTAADGQAPVYGRIWGKHMAALHVTPGSIGVKTITFAKTFSQRQRTTQRAFMPELGEAGSHFVKVAWNSDEKVVAADLGYMIKNAIP